MKLSGTTRIAGVIGFPIAHSLSPFLMNRWIRKAGLDAAYIALPAQPVLGITDIKALSRSGLAGLNVTLPFKPMAAAAADFQSEAVKRTGAANLLRFTPDGIHAFNTDVEGIRYAVDSAGYTLEGAKLLVLGAGGVARAVCEAGRQARADKVVIVNRTFETAEALARTDRTFAAERWEARQKLAANTDIIINATSLGLDGMSQPELNWEQIPEKTVAFDTLYTPANRPFLKQAADSAHRVIDGLPMFLGQARPSFKTLFNCPVPGDEDVLNVLRQELVE
ncbi:shikimate dehydrogenase family protein [Hyphobacterium sp.]|uniref:shikimate dehydrogenase family protein n=1 Tax=Hyphobacterium sp. TaxID=2004662 RepID=UPI003BA84790